MEGQVRLVTRSSSWGRRAAGAALLLLATSCSPGPATPASSGSATPAASTATAGEALVSCQDTPPIRENQYCHVLEVDGTAVRYGLLPATRQPSSGLVVMDLGGPGISPLAGDGLTTAVQALGGNLLTGYDLVVIEEPWVTRPLADPCRAALSDYYVAAHEGRPVDGASDRLTRVCAPSPGPAWGFTPESYSAAVQAIATTHQRRLVGFVGASFASVRLQYLDPRSFSWSVLVRPFPVGVDGGTLLRRRLDLLSARATSPGLPSSGQVDGRSIPLTRFDAASAEISATYDGAEPPSYTTPSAVGRRSDSLWQRYGSIDLSPSWLAYWGEVCPVTGAWPAPTAASGSVAAVLETMHVPCRSVRPAASRTGAASMQVTCVVVSRSDAVVGGDLALDHLRASDVVRVDGEPAHNSSAGVEECVRKVAAGSGSGSG